MSLDFTFSPKITKEFILSKVNQETILSYYLRLPVESKKLYCSPLRDDRNPTCSFYKSKSGIVYFHDFALNKSYNCFSTVMEMYSCTYYKALQIIANDFGLVKDNNLNKSKKIIPVKELNNKDTTQINVEIQDFTDNDLAWWNRYGVTKDILKKYKVFSCKNVFLNSVLLCTYTPKCPIYGYYMGKQDGQELWRIYFPYRKSYRFLSNTNAKKIQGFKQLPETGKLLVITKSQKDIMCLYSMGVPAIAPNSETLFISNNLLTELKSRFEHIIVIYDQDRPGLHNMAKIRKVYPELNYFVIPSKYGAKDISDFYKKYGRKKTLNSIKEVLKYFISVWQK